MTSPRPAKYKRQNNGISSPHERLPKGTDKMTATTCLLGSIATARSGDKGNHANVAVIARSQAGYRYLEQVLTAERVAEYFDSLGVGEVKRFELPKLGSMNFLLIDALAGGASQSLRIDTQGKLLGTAILDLPLPTPDNLDDMRAVDYP